MLSQALRVSSGAAARSVAPRASAQLSAASVTASAGARRVMSSTAAKGRPLSPHLMIYKFPFNAQTSVAFRATGIIMTGGMCVPCVFVVHATRTCELRAQRCRLCPSR